RPPSGCWTSSSPPPPRSCADGAVHPAPAPPLLAAPAPPLLADLGVVVVPMSDMYVKFTTGSPRSAGREGAGGGGVSPPSPARLSAARVAPRGARPPPR